MAPRARVRSTVAEIIPNALPLGILQKSHNGVELDRGEIDPRFAPLIIVVRRDWLKAMPEPYRCRQDEALRWTPDTKWPEMVWLTPAFFTEWGLRHYCHKALIADDTFAALEAYLTEHYDEFNMPAKSMAKLVDGKLVVDMTKSAGPFYCDTIAAIEHHYADKCRNLRADQIP